MRSVTKTGRLSLQHFGLCVLASLLTVLATPGLLQVAVPTQAQVAPVQPIPVEAVPIQAAHQPSNATDAVLGWNVTALSVLPTPPAPQQNRGLAIVHAAIFDAVNAIDHRYTTYAVDAKAPAGASASAAASAAGHGVLTRLYPAQKAVFDAALTTALAKIADG